MPRPLWKGSISFGLVSIPIELHTAVRNHRPKFRMLHKTDKSPVQFTRVCARDGAPPATAKRIRAVLERYVGESLVRFDRNDAARRLTSVADVAGARFDRDFPHTLKVRVRLERPVAVLRRGADAWVVSSTARVLQELNRRPYPRLPRIWLPASAEVSVNSTLGGVGAMGVAAVAPLASHRLGSSVRQVQVGSGELSLQLASGTELRLGDSGDVRLKLAIARQILPIAGHAAYVDVSVPERPVAGYNPQVEG